MTAPLHPDSPIVARLYVRSGAARWGVTAERFAAALAAGLERVANPDSLHVEDLALAVACADGIDAAWEHFVLTHRPLLYRAADAIDRHGGGRELADELYAELFGKSLFKYFHGRSRLDTWLRAVLAQRHIDRLRASRHTDPLPNDDGPAALTTTARAPDPDAARFGEAMRQALAAAIDGLDARDRLRLRLYYAQGLKLAAIGKVLGEHEGSVSRHLTRTRGMIRDAVESTLRTRHGFDDREVAECFAQVAEDPGGLDLGKIGLQARSNE
jgi:RNA polymerase sigma-70 factor (ECF subfamily)